MSAFAEDAAGSMFNVAGLLKVELDRGAGHVGREGGHDVNHVLGQHAERVAVGGVRRTTAGASAGACVSVCKACACVV